MYRKIKPQVYEIDNWILTRCVRMRKEKNNMMMKAKAKAIIITVTSVIEFLMVGQN